MPKQAKKLSELCPPIEMGELTDAEWDTVAPELFAKIAEGERSDKERLHTDNMTLLNYIVLGSSDYAEHIGAAALVEPQQTTTPARLHLISELSSRFSLLIREGYSVAYTLEQLRLDGWVELVQPFEPAARITGE